MENNITTLFVYGTLRKKFRSAAFKYISNYFSFVSEAKAKGLLYVGDYPAAVATTKETYITGELYKLRNNDDFDSAITELDTYEGVDEEGGKMPLYKRELTNVIYNDSTMRAWIYWYNRKIDGLIFLPTGDIMDYIEINSKA